MVMRLRIKRREITSILIAILPILSIYRLGSTSLSFADAALTIIVARSLFLWVKSKRAIGRCVFLAYFFIEFIVSCILIVLFNQKFTSDFVHKWLKLVVYYYVVDVVSVGGVDGHTLCKWSMRCGFVVSLILILQVILYNLFGYQFFPYIRFLNLAYTRTVWTPTDLINLQIQSAAEGYWRCCSIFCEPAHFSEYTLLPLTITIFTTDNLIDDKRRILCAACITVAIILSASAIGTILSVMVWCMYIFLHLRRKVRGRFLCAIVMLVIGGFVFFIRTNFWDAAVGRVQSVMSSGGTTGTIRLLQGLSIFARLDPFEKIVGIGIGNVQSYLLENNITTAYLTDAGNDFMNGFSTVLVSGGVIGFAAYMFIWCRQFNTYNNVASRVVFLVISAMFCASALFYAPVTVMYLVFIRNISSRIDDGSRNVMNSDAT